MESLYFVILFLLGTCFGSFISVLSYRLPKGEDFVFLPSHCPKCKFKLKWFDNIPLLGFIILLGKCRSCRKKISFRYPILEFVTGLLFVLSGLYLTTCSDMSLLCNNYGIQFWIVLFVLLLITVLLITIFIIDYDYMVIPDEFVFLLIGFSTLLLVLNAHEMLYSYLFSGLIASNFLLLLHLLTSGRGMGLGDVKFALPIGIMLGLTGTIYWLMISFIIGGFVATILLFTKDKKLKSKIAFGPFLIIGFFITLIFFNKLDLMYIY